ncbi:hypothetical protein [Micromonospora sp. NBC_01796]|uniref:hypothetical protein n=1 Tax=Micromonospora sp. NBC_01796 TaxID=2975987 RepID=UPI002DDAE986|nr:hypothetical protein [Micromonospora sp. NBC_01796]WSA86229.1 DUF6042 family protein [Micromonospora sp. NBC_01796]
MTPRWQRAATMPSWIRWLPCSFVYLTVVPGPVPFRRSAWHGLVPWDDALWCDPGDVEEWVTRSRHRHPRREAVHAELHARQHYDWLVEVRGARIELFGEMCRRRDLPIPHTVGELLPCLAGFGLFEIVHDGATDDPWVRPRLDQDPLDVLPLSVEERELEIRAQRDDRAVLVAIAVRRLAQRTRRRWRRRMVSTDLAGLAEVAGLPVEQTRQGLTDLGGIADLEVDWRGGDGRVRLTVPWPDFRSRFPFNELPAPEHAV